MPRPRLPYVDEATERRRARGRKYYHEAKAAGKVDEYQLRRRYGISQAQYDALDIAQNGRCAICRRLPNGHGRLHVDHCHETKRVRGLLCFTCNQALGAFRDSPRLLCEAARYVTDPNMYLSRSVDDD